MSGRLRAVMAPLAAGTASRAVQSTGWPDFAAQPAAGIAKSGAPSRRRRPPPRLARRRGLQGVDGLGDRRVVAPAHGRRLQPRGRRASADADDLRAAGLLGARGLSRASACSRRRRQRAAVAEQDRRAQRRRHELGGRDGARQSAGSTSVTARGRVSPAREGKAASAAPAASAIGSALPTRVVLRVANRREAEVGRGLLVLAAARRARAPAATRRRRLSPPPEGVAAGPSPARRTPRGAPAGARTGRRRARGAPSQR